MRKLKKKFRKKKDHEGIVLKPKAIHRKPFKIVKIKKLGRWCEYYEGRLPFPSECAYNKDMPISRLFKGSEVKICHDRSNCVKCRRYPEFLAWKRGEWNKVKEAISRGEDLTDMESPVYRKEY